MIESCHKIKKSKILLKSALQKTKSLEDALDLNYNRLRPMQSRVLVLKFIENCKIIVSKSISYTNDLYEHFKDFCKSNNLRNPFGGINPFPKVFTNLGCLVHIATKKTVGFV